jgi:two-component sensor histidine kinase
LLVLTAVVGIQLIWVLQHFCRRLVFMGDDTRGELLSSVWWTAIDVRACLWIGLAPLLALIIVRREWFGWKTALAHLLLVVSALFINTQYLHRVAHYQGLALERAIENSSLQQPGRENAMNDSTNTATLRRALLLRPYTAPFGPWYMAGEVLLILTYFIPMTLVGYAARLFASSAQRTHQTERLRVTLAKQRHESLCNRLTHHFLFNTLNSICALTLTDGRAARMCISQLSELLRAAIDAMPEGEVRLDKEMKLLNTYLTLQKTRFGDKLDYSIDIEAGLEGVMVPAFILQPLVENAFEHGFREHANVARIEVSARRVDGCCRLEVADNGSLVESEIAIEEKFGLGITRERLELQYDRAAKIWYEPNHPRGLRALVIVPFRVESEVGATCSLSPTE